MPPGSRIDNRLGETLEPGANEIRLRIANLTNNRYGTTAESGLLGLVRLVRFR